MKPQTKYQLDVTPAIPPRLARLEELANNLWYSWDHYARELYAQLDPALWVAVNHSPKAFLRRVDEQKLRSAAEDPVFLSNFSRVLSAYDSYHSEPDHHNGSGSLAKTDLVAYFCAEFGIHESLPIYSGGLGILAGDHCKAASDMRLRFVAVGLMYRQGYFSQTMDREGAQHALYADSDFAELPVNPVLDAGGAEMHIRVELPGRAVEVKLWKVRVGHVTIYLLDTNVGANSDADRRITHRLYGGDRSTRLEQEIILGMGGVQALAAIGVHPTVWHINEGHAAFLVLERVRRLVRQGLGFRAALEAVASATVFTTHTAVPAGHDHFPENMIQAYFSRYCEDTGIGTDTLMSLGRGGEDREFNMTALAVRGSRHRNGVSRIHRDVSAGLLRNFWPQVSPEESPIGHVTNGVHVPTFLSDDWRHAFERYIGADWSQHLLDPSWWTRVERLPDHIFWSVHQFLKARMLHLVRHRIGQQHARNRGSDAHLDRLFRHADPDHPNVLTIGFGRRFATYKRAGLLFENLDRLRDILSNPDRPVVFLFAGKAHPADGPGQALIRQVFQIGRMPEFEGKILFVEDYDLQLARRLVSGVDVWLNSPRYPLEASGTSGMKAGMNGVINLSVLDGWWDEGYERGNGWAIKPARDEQDEERRDREEAAALYEILEDQVIPLYYEQGTVGYSPRWIEMAKRSMATILPRFSARRMLEEYLARFYGPAAMQGRAHGRDNFRAAAELAEWTERVRAAWPRVGLWCLATPPARIGFGNRMVVEVAAQLGGLQPADVVVELVFDPDYTGRDIHLAPGTCTFRAEGLTNAGDSRFVLDLQPQLCGRLHYSIRCYPHHALLSHRFELGLMVWA